MDELKKYLQSQQQELERELPSERVWAGVSASLEPPVKLMRLPNWSIAASVIVLVGLGILIFNKSNKSEHPIVKSNIKEILAPAIEQIDSSNKDVAKQIPNANNLVSNKEKNYPSAAPITTIHSVQELNDEDQKKLSLTEASFTQVINLQKARISTTPIFAESPAYFKDFHTQLAQIEKDEKQIKHYIQKNGMSDELLDQLINVYQQKLNMLKLLQTELQKLNSRYKQNRPAVDTMKTYFLNL